jgi:D-arabinose 1-dehydrogenase-like Zn-dependent alcohol dehydrogenase
MRAAVITEFNKDWEIKDLPTPKPAPGQVLIRVHASGMCGTDLHVHHGMFPLPRPIIAGHEATGDIVELGAGVTHLQVGDRVGVSWHQKGCGRCNMCQSGAPNFCNNVQTWMHLGGGNSAFMLAWGTGCTLLPEGVSYEDAAPIFCAGYTVMSGLRNADPKPGERVAILGIGGLGHLALQFSKALGLETVALTGQASKQDELRALGADTVVLTGDDPGKALTEAGGVNIILSTTNSAAQISRSLHGLRPGGRLINMGVPDGALMIDPSVLTFRQLQIRGSSQDERSDLVEALELVAKKKVKPQLELYPLEESNQVRARLEAGKVRYRAVLQHSH